MNKTNENGRSMIEMLGVLAIIGVLSVGGIAGYSKAMMQFKINKSINQVSEIVANVRTLYAQQKTCEGLNISTALSMGAIPDDLSTIVSGSYSVSNIFGGYIDVNCVWARYDKPDTYTKSFSIVFQGMPKNACVALATKDWGSASSTGLTAMQVYGGHLSGYYDYMGSTGSNCVGSEGYLVQACTNGSTPSVPISPSLLSRACECSGNNCAIAWFFN